MGFTLVEIMIVCAIISLLAVLAIPNFVKARATSRQNLCIGNLRQIEGAKQEWALEHGKSAPDTPVESDLSPYFGRGVGGATIGFVCPAGGSQAATFALSYEINALDTPPTCRIDPLNHKLD